MPQDDLETRFARSIVEGGLLARDEVVVAAVSGGADSVAMLHLLSSLNRRQDWALKLHVAHLNHQLRGEASDADAAFVEQLARELGHPCTVESADVEQRSRADGVSIEQAARQCRFAFWERLCLRVGVRAVALGHHADDNAETILHRIVRGTGLRGLGGIRRVRPIREGSDIRLIRPMLEFRRAEIEHYLAERGMTFRHDVTNDSALYTRNRIRHEVLPLLRERLNPQAEDALIRLAEQARGLDAYLTETGERMLESLVVEHNDRELVLHSPSLARKARVIQTQLIRRAILRMGVGEGELAYGHFNAVADLAAGQEGSKALDLPGGLRVSRRYDRLVFEWASGDRITATETGEFRVAMNGTTALPAHGVQITVDVLTADAATIDAHIHRRTGRSGTSREEWLDADQVHPPLIARSRRPGDRFFPLGMTGMKKLSDFFIDEKIDARRRDRAVVLCDQLGPIWIVSFRIDERVRLTRATRRVLRVRAVKVGDDDDER